MYCSHAFACVLLSPSVEFLNLRKSLDQIRVSEHLPLLDTDPNATAFSSVTMIPKQNLSFLSVEI